MKLGSKDVDATIKVVETKIPVEVQIHAKGGGGGGDVPPTPPVLPPPKQKKSCPCLLAIIIAILATALLTAAALLLYFRDYQNPEMVKTKVSALETQIGEQKARADKFERENDACKSDLATLKNEGLALAGEKGRLEGELAKMKGELQQCKTPPLSTVLAPAKKPASVVTKKLPEAGVAKAKTNNSSIPPAQEHKCTVFVDGKLVADFRNAKANPYGEVVAPFGEGPKCLSLRERFKTENPQYRYTK